MIVNGTAVWHPEHGLGVAGHEVGSMCMADIPLDRFVDFGDHQKVVKVQSLTSLCRSVDPHWAIVMHNLGEGRS